MQPNNSSKVYRNEINSEAQPFAKEYDDSPVLGLRIIKAANQPKTLPISETTTFHSSDSVNQIKCRLCDAMFVDAVALAKHKCTMIENVNYPCDECGKSFSCPANLASHRRWHSISKDDVKNLKRKTSEESSKAKRTKSEKFTVSKDVESHVNSMLKSCKPKRTLFATSVTETQEKTFPCSMCKKKFRKQSFMKRHFDKKHARRNNIKQEHDDSIENLKFDPKVLNDYFDSGLKTLANAAEIHSKRIQSADETPVRNPNKSPNTILMSVVDMRASTPPATVKVQNWLPPSPPLSDALSPLSSVADDTESNSSSIDLSPSPQSTRRNVTTDSSHELYRPIYHQEKPVIDQAKLAAFCPPYFPYYATHHNFQSHFHPQPAHPTNIISQQYLAGMAAYKDWTQRVMSAWSFRNQLSSKQHNKL